MNQSSSHGHDTFPALAAACIKSSSFLAARYGHRLTQSAATGRGFTVEFTGKQVGVRVTYQVGDPVMVYVCLLEDGRFPSPPGEIRPDTRIAMFDLSDVEAILARNVEAPEPWYAIPTAEVLNEYSKRLHRSGATILEGDLSSVPGLQARVLEQARAAAIDRWGERASDFGW